MAECAYFSLDRRKLLVGARFGLGQIQGDGFGVGKGIFLKKLGSEHIVFAAAAFKRRGEPRHLLEKDLFVAHKPLLVFSGGDRGAFELFGLG